MPYSLIAMELLLKPKGEKTFICPIDSLIFSENGSASNLLKILYNFIISTITLCRPSSFHGFRHRDVHRISFNQAFKHKGLTNEWDVELYGKLLKIGGGKERMTGEL